MGNIQLYRKLKGNVLTLFTTQDYTYGLDTMTLTQRQQEKMQICEANGIYRE